MPKKKVFHCWKAKSTNGIKRKYAYHGARENERKSEVYKKFKFNARLRIKFICDARAWTRLVGFIILIKCCLISSVFFSSSSSNFIWLILRHSLLWLFDFLFCFLLSSPIGNISNHNLFDNLFTWQPILFCGCFETQKMFRFNTWNTRGCFCGCLPSLFIRYK